MIEFGDGQIFDIQGELRIEEADGQYFVVGNGALLPVDSRDEAERLLHDMNADELYLKMKLFRSNTNRTLYNEYVQAASRRKKDREAGTHTDTEGHEDR